MVDMVGIGVDTCSRATTTAGTILSRGCTTRRHPTGNRCYCSNGRGMDKTLVAWDEREDVGEVGEAKAWEEGAEVGAGVDAEADASDVVDVV